MYRSFFGEKVVKSYLLSSTTGVTLWQSATARTASKTRVTSDRLILVGAAGGAGPAPEADAAAALAKPAFR